MVSRASHHALKVHGLATWPMQKGVIYDDQDFCAKNGKCCGFGGGGVGVGGVSVRTKRLLVRRCGVAGCAGGCVECASYGAAGGLPAPLRGGAAATCIYSAAAGVRSTATGLCSTGTGLVSLPGLWPPRGDSAGAGGAHRMAPSASSWLAPRVASRAGPGGRPACTPIRTRWGPPGRTLLTKTWAVFDELVFFG